MIRRVFKHVMLSKKLVVSHAVVRGSAEFNIQITFKLPVCGRA